MSRILPALVLAALAFPVHAEDAKEESRHCRWHNWGRSEFAWQVQGDIPAKDLGRALDERSGLGIGMQWTRFWDNGTANRTRLEWNVFPEGNAVAGLKTKASNYVFSFDRMYFFSHKDQGLYVLGGLGAVRWFMDRTPEGGPTASSHTTKLAVTGGAGWRFNRNLSAEARYMVSTVDRTFDGNVFQLSAGVRF
jgi:hypothetical protein